MKRSSLPNIGGFKGVELLSPQSCFQETLNYWFGLVVGDLSPLVVESKLWETPPTTKPPIGVKLKLAVFRLSDVPKESPQ